MRKRLMLIAAMVLISVSRTAHAQNNDELLRIKTTEFEAHMAELDLPVAQREAAQAMFADYSREFDDAMAMYLELQKWLWSTNLDWAGAGTPREFGHSLWTEGQQVLICWQKGCRALEARYFDQLGALAIGLDEKIQSMRRKHLRDRLLTSALWFGGEYRTTSCDLVELAAKVDPALPFNPAMQAVLHDYEMALYQLLRQHDEKMISHRLRIKTVGDALDAAKEAGQDLNKPAEAFADLIVEPYRRSVELWQLEASTAEKIAALLNADQLPRFHDVLTLALHPYLRRNIHEPTTTSLLEQGPAPEELFELAFARPGLSEDQRSRLEVLQDQYRKDRDAALPRLHRIYAETSSPDAMREACVLYFTGQKEMSKERQDVLDKTWNDAKKAWLVRCTTVEAAIKAIIDEHAEESPP